MPLFEEDPAHLSKSRLKSDLVAHSVALPPAQSKKDVYVELHLKHIDQKNAADFSSDEEDQVRDVADKEEDAEDAEIPDPSGLTDDDLKAALLEHGFKAGPIVASTRAVYEKKLRKLLQPDGQDHLNGAEKGVVYSDSEEEDEEEEEGSQGAKEETVERSDQTQQESSQNGDFFYPQCFLPSSRLLDMPIVDKHSMKNQSLYYTPKASPYKWGMKLSQEPVKDTFKDMFPDTQATPTGIHATRRKPIKGAAGRPIQYVYPDTPASPTTQERRAVERRLVPIQIQILVFLIVVVLLYLIYACVEDNSFSPFVALLESLNQGSDGEEGLLLPAETQDTPALSGQE
ncbi:LEM domain-containing protein 1 isoform X5 [Dicentrarchus labrax]|uniref:LEM domain-containing protein 1 isoform X5 n=1 Tax=Dicentrarchus labrax TaxID=13489 RepID=UPI0021F53F6E|nr:LEM domain-containing protein 1 isoform X5 [Dicentrarchus labrax]